MSAVVAQAVVAETGDTGAVSEAAGGAEKDAAATPATASTAAPAPEGAGAAAGGADAFSAFGLSLAGSPSRVTLVFRGRLVRFRTAHHQGGVFGVRRPQKHEQTTIQLP